MNKMWRVLGSLWMCAMALRLLSPEAVGATQVPICSGHGMEVSLCAKAAAPVILPGGGGRGEDHQAQEREKNAPK